MTIHSLGLLFAIGCALCNVLMDIAQKRAFSHRPLLRSIVWVRCAVFASVTVYVLLRACAGNALPWTIFRTHGLLHRPHFVIVLLLDGLLVALSSLGYYRAIQTAPLSLTIPFLTFTPVFLLASSALVLHEKLTLHHFEGVSLVVLGSLLMYRAQFKVGWTAPLRALVRQPGSRYMLMVSVILSFTNVLDKWLIGHSDAYTFVWLYALTSMVIFASAIFAFERLTQRRRNGAHTSSRQARTLNIRWLLLAGVADAITISLQFAALGSLSAVVVISIKRAGILFAVLAGWWIFKERDLANRLLAAVIMICGAIMLYLPFTARHDLIVVSVCVLLACAVPLTIDLRARRNASSTLAFTQNPDASE